MWGVLCVHMSCGSHVSAECMSVGCTLTLCTYYYDLWSMPTLVYVEMIPSYSEMGTIYNCIV